MATSPQMRVYEGSKVKSDSAIATQPVKSAGETPDFAALFARVVTMFTSLRSEELLPHIASFAVTEFGCKRAELWLWSPGSKSAYPVHCAGQAALEPRQCAFADSAIGQVATEAKAIENVALTTLGDAEHAFGEVTGLTRISAYPLPGDEVLAVLALYTDHEAPEQALQIWRAYAAMCSIKVPDLFTAREQSKQITQLSLLFEATRLLNSTLDLSELLNLILKIAQQESCADRGSVFLVDAATQELWSIVASGLALQEIRVPIGHGVAGHVAHSGETVNVEDAYSLDYFDRSFDMKFGYCTRSLLSIPIRHRDGAIVGVLQLLNKQNGPAFTAEDVDFLCKLSGHMAMALENARLHRESLEKQRMEKELALARQIQYSLLPDAPPVVPGFEIAVANEPCFECGGDYYDFLRIGPRSLLLVIADVEGKGVASALVMANLQATLRALVHHLHSLEELSIALNEAIYNDSKRGKYLSCFLGLLDTRSRSLNYINCGHIPPLLVSGATGEFRRLEEGGTVIGLFPGAQYTRGSVKLETGDVFVTCTDGISEASSPDDIDSEYGTERLAEFVSNRRQGSAEQIVESVLVEVNAFCQNTKEDDKVLMVMKVAEANAAAEPAQYLN